jgi:hypothetical protein
VVRLRDTYSSTDGQAHQLDLLTYHGTDSSGDASFWFKWASGALQAYPIHATVPGAPTGPATVLVKGHAAAADGDEHYAQGAIVFSTPPDGITFTGHKNTTSTNSNQFEAALRRTVPAGGSFTTTEVFVTTFTAADAASLASQAAAAMSPGIAISSPANGSSTTATSATVTGSTTAGANGLPQYVAVNGHAASVAPNGTWSASVPLNLGANTITALATDTGGLTAQAQETVTRTVPPSSPGGAAHQPQASIAGAIAFDGTNLSFKATCTADPGQTCTEIADALTKEKRQGARIVALTARKHAVRQRSRTVTVSVGHQTFQLAAGQTLTVKVPLNATGRQLLARFHRLPVALRLQLRTASGAVVTASTRRLTLHPAAKKRKGSTKKH